MARAALTVAVGLTTVPVAAGAAGAAGDGRTVLCDRADYGCVEGTGYHGQSVWGANYGKTGHNCTSYVSWVLAQQGVLQPWRPMGDGGRWDDNARGKAPVDDAPAVGAVAVWEGGNAYSHGSRGHVAMVDAVTPTGIQISEDNTGGGTRRVQIERGSSSWPAHFVHIHDLAPSGRMVAGLVSLARSLRLPAAGSSARPLGTAGDVAVAGDWDGDGTDTPGTFRDGTWTLPNGKAGKKRKVTVRHFGRAGDVPVVGDWDGDGRDQLGVYRAGRWFLSSPTKADPDHAVQLQLGGPDDQPVVGDWDGSDGDTVGIFHDGAWTLSNDLYGGVARRIRFQYGKAGDVPVAGNWDGVRGDSVGVYRSGQWLLTNTNSGVLRRLVDVTFGDATATPLAGNWDGEGGDTIGLSR